MAANGTSSVLKKEIPYKFKDPSLLDTRAFVGGEWINSSTGKTFPVLDPEDDKVAAEVTDMSRKDVAAAIEAAHEAFQSYKKIPHRTRRFMVRAWADAIKANREDLAAICTLELGKPYSESLGTVKYGTDYLDWFDGLIERLGGETIPAAKQDNRVITIRQPQGVVAAITPWNSPIAMITRKVGAAIAAGNTVVCKPAPETPLCAIALAKLFERAGFPKGVLNIVPCSAENTPECGDEMTSSKFVKHLSFTGSTPVGKLLNTECAKSLKRTSMELGGNAPFIVFEDADMKKAADGLIASKFRSSGQTCVCANRILVHKDVINDFRDMVLKRLPEVLVSGSVWDKKTNFGPLYSSKGVEKVKRHLEDFKSKGATIHAGWEGGKLDSPNMIPPTLLVHSPEFADRKALQVSTEETFGPLASLMPFTEEAEAIKYANEINVGLASYFFTKDHSRMWRVAEALETGMVGVQVGLVSAVEQPFGGIKESGMGREGGGNCLEEYTEIKSITFGL
ncbi:succinate-semialdehyde dehydrogenase [Rhizodiscina lignyota]|uniref:Succinate-semialdehyde dehydrogenase, mitochondrial n=1 Tax=Rhizodiscina lignyota TaxID=1504668 RepID=A0A9P4M498_9PEZI|nr:succinate-semialdehyde dehydrogenase [Rhizodiscina lignyota]